MLRWRKSAHDELNVRWWPTPRRFNKSQVIKIYLGATNESNPPLRQRNRNRKAIIHQMRMKSSKQGVDQESTWYPHITPPTSEDTRTASQSSRSRSVRPLRTSYQGYVIDHAQNPGRKECYNQCGGRTKMPLTQGQRRRQ